MQFYFFVGKGKTRVGGSVNHGIKNSSPYLTLGFQNHNFQFLTRLTASLTDDCHFVFLQGISQAPLFGFSWWKILDFP